MDRNEPRSRPPLGARHPSDSGARHVPQGAWHHPPPGARHQSAQHAPQRGARHLSSNSGAGQEPPNSGARHPPGDGARRGRSLGDGAWHPGGVKGREPEPKTLATLGVILMVIGLAAIVFPASAALAGELVLGALLLALGVALIGHGLQVRGWSGWGALVVSGSLSAGLGMLLLGFPVAGLLSLTLGLGIFFVVGGALRVVAALRMRPESGWVALLTGGSLATLLGLMVLLGWPTSAPWFLGLLLGVDVLLGGVSLLATAAWVRRHRAG